jgi:hypothetical protein
VGRKKITAAFDGGRLSSDGGVMLLAQAERRLGIADRLAALMPDRRDPARVTVALANRLQRCPCCTRPMAVCDRYAIYDAVRLAAAGR